MLEELTKHTINAMILMSEEPVDGIEENIFKKHGNLDGAMELLDYGHAENVNDNNYRLTEKGVNYLNNLIKFVGKEFK